MSRHKTLRLSDDDDALLRHLSRKMKRDESEVLRLALRALAAERPPIVLTSCAGDRRDWQGVAEDVGRFCDSLRRLEHYIKTDLTFHPRAPSGEYKRIVLGQLIEMTPAPQEVRSTMLAISRLLTRMIDWDIMKLQRIASSWVSTWRDARAKSRPASNFEAGIRLAALVGLIPIPDELRVPDPKLCRKAPMQQIAPSTAPASPPSGES